MALQSPLPYNVRQGLASISGSLFIQNKTRDCGDGHSYHTGHEALSNLPLQMMLYFNIIYFPFWCVSEILILELKFDLLSSYYQFLLIAALVILVFVESLRLYLGYIGNLHEKVPELAGFLLLTFLIQIPIMLFLLTDEEILILPLEYAVHAIYMIFLKAELMVSFLVLKVMTRQLATQFYLLHSEDWENKELKAKDSAAVQYGHSNVTAMWERDALMY
ncbi:transmembrane protein 17B-like [Discoglossus pictus]